MPRLLHVASKITQEEADELDGLLLAYTTADAAMVAAEAALDALILAARQASGRPSWQETDILGDGESKHFDDCAQASGRRPATLAYRSGGPPAHARTRMPFLPGTASSRRSVNAVSSVAQMEAADVAAVARRAAYDARASSAQDLNTRVIQLSYIASARVKVGQIVDIWGDGQLIEADAMVVPPRLQRVEVKQT